ncbi:hypothetical protein KAX02_06595 [candidate division WOR-3 bacterium]|nr:hypothetical protein [candidate division WOR-3 bacterium]
MILLFLIASLSISAYDTPNDAGSSITLKFSSSLPFISGEVMRKNSDGEFERMASICSSDSSWMDNFTVDGVEYFYKIVLTTEEGIITSETVSAVSSPQWFHKGRTIMLVMVILVCGFILFFIREARGGKELYVRPIAGIEALDEAVGRATELGRPIMFITGIMDMDDLQTIAGITILRRVAKKAAEYEAQILVPTSRSLVMTAAQETVKEAYYDAGRPDIFNPDNIFYLTDDQFGFAAGCDGIMVREKPGAIFFMGSFYAESLILAETGHSTGAIQIAGTAMPSQLPFFVTACDYTLIGEEFFAASAYLSRDPLQLGSLKGQDWGKLIFFALIVVGTVLMTFGITVIRNILMVR